MKAPYLQRLLKSAPKRKREPANMEVESVKTAKQGEETSSTEEPLCTDPACQPNLDQHEVRERDAKLQKLHGDTTPSAGVGAPEYSLAFQGRDQLTTNDDDSSCSLYPQLSVFSNEKIKKLTASYTPHSLDHRTFLESLLKLHAKFVNDTSHAFQSNPSILQVATQAYQTCLDSLLGIYYDIHSRNTSSESMNEIFQENYRQILHLQETFARSHADGSPAMESNDFCKHSTKALTNPTNMPLDTYVSMEGRGGTHAYESAPRIEAAPQISALSHGSTEEQEHGLQTEGKIDDINKNLTIKRDTDDETDATVKKRTISGCGKVIESAPPDGASGTPSKPHRSANELALMEGGVSSNKENNPLGGNLATPVTGALHDVKMKGDCQAWKCSECTLLNSPTKRRCAVCLARRPVSSKTNLSQAPERALRSRRKKEQDTKNASQCLLLESQMPSDPAEKKQKPQQEMTYNHEHALGRIDSTQSAPERALRDGQEFRRSTSATESTGNTRRITLDQEATDESLSLIASQETQDPTLSSSTTKHSHSEKTSVVKGEAVHEPTSGLSNPYSVTWQSNLPARRFDRELEIASINAKGMDAASVKSAGAPSGWLSTQRRGKAKTEESTSDIWTDQDVSEPYHEVVRGKARKTLPTHDCPECAAFYQGLVVDSQSMDIRRFCRHRSRFGPPPETPEGYWELDFIDELRAKEREKRLQNSEEAAGAKGSTGRDKP